MKKYLYIIVVETQIAIEPINKLILDIYLSAEKGTCLLPRSFYILYLKNMENIKSQ